MQCLSIIMTVKYLIATFAVIGNCVSDKIILDGNYSLETLPPTEDQSPLLLQASMNLRNILDVVETKQQISLEVTLRYFWKDGRITPVKEHLKGVDSIGPYINLHPSETKRLWMPDTFIDQAVDLRKPTYFLEPSSLRVYNDSTLRFSTRMNFDVACQMDFHKFPWDVQVCKVKFESFSYSNQQLRMEWLEGKASQQVNPSIRLDQFSHKVEFHDTYSTDGYDISYPGIILKITLKRNIGYFVIQTFIPSALFVTLGYLSLYISPDAIPGRVTLAMTTILTLTAMFSGIRHSVPKVSYITFLDIWMLTCLIFVNFFMFEFVFVVYLKSIKRETISRTFEKRCRVLFPVLFIVFNIIYWPLVSNI